MTPPQAISQGNVVPATAKRQPSRPGPLPTAQTALRQKSMDPRYRNLKGVNVHIHNLKKVPGAKPFKVG